jgi:hypothetical protein
MKVYTMQRLCSLLLLAGLVAAQATAMARAEGIAESWRREWPRTEFSRHSVELSEIVSGGPPKDGIPSIDDPRFVPVSQVDDLAAMEPVIGFALNGEARAYPLRVLTWHEIVNDEVCGVPVVITYCPLCNSAIVFDRRVNSRVLGFGTTGKLRNSDLVMCDA